MEITSIKVIPVFGDHRLKAYVSIVIDSCFAIHDLKIIQKDDKMFVAMPTKKNKEHNSFRDIAHPIDEKTREKLEESIFNEYKNIVASSAEANQFMQKIRSS